MAKYSKTTSVTNLSSFFLVLKHNRVSEVFKGFKVHDFEYLLRSKKLHFEIEFMSLEMCHLLLTSKNY